MSAVVYVSIGNSDDRLTQKEWSEFWADTSATLLPVIQHRIGVWMSDPVGGFQNACWAFVPWPQVIPDAQEQLARVAIKYGQEAIAWAEAPETAFLGPAWMLAGQPETSKAVEEFLAGIEPGKTWVGRATARRERAAGTPWIVEVPPGSSIDDVDAALLIRALPGDHGVMLVPADPVPVSRETNEEKT